MFLLLKLNWCDNFRYDTQIYTNESQPIIWAVGPVNSKVCIIINDHNQDVYNIQLELKHKGSGYHLVEAYYWMFGGSLGSELKAVKPLEPMFTLTSRQTTLNQRIKPTSTHSRFLCFSYMTFLNKKEAIRTMSDTLMILIPDCCHHHCFFAGRGILPPETASRRRIFRLWSNSSMELSDSR